MLLIIILNLAYSFDIVFANDMIPDLVIFDNIRATILPSTEIVEPPSVSYDDLLGAPLDKRIRFLAGDGNTYRLFVST